MVSMMIGEMGDLWWSLPPAFRGVYGRKQMRLEVFVQLNTLMLSKRGFRKVYRSKKTKFSLPGSRTPRCPVTGDDVTDTPGKTIRPFNRFWLQLEST
jgi:hypothetical protein